MGTVVWNQQTVVLPKEIVFIIMSVKIKDVLNVFKQNRVDRALGLLESQPRYRVESTTKSWTQNIPEKAKCSVNTVNTVNSSQSSPSWTHNNIARAEEGTTFYFRQKLS